MQRKEQPRREIPANRIRDSSLLSMAAVGSFFSFCIFHSFGVLVVLAAGFGHIPRTNAKMSDNATDDGASYDGTGCGSAYVCANTSVTGDNILTAIIIDAILGWLCWVGFVLWRGFFPVYRGREILPGVRYRPPALSLKGIGRYWNWMWPTFGVTDAEFLKSAGLDALVAVRILSYGLALFLPVGALAIAILIPVNYTSNGLIVDGAVASNTSDSNLTYVFARMTMSNIPNGSSLL